MKNTVDPMATQSGVIAALLAEKGYTGPEHVLDGKEGFSHVFSTDWKFDILTDGLGESWRILQCGMKFFPTEALTHAPISATLDLVIDNDLQPDQGHRPVEEAQDASQQPDHDHDNDYSNEDVGRYIAQALHHSTSLTKRRFPTWSTAPGKAARATLSSLSRDPSSLTAPCASGSTIQRMRLMTSFCR